MFPETFQHTVDDETKDVFVMFYSMKSTNLQAWSELAKEYKDNDNLIIAAVDRSSYPVQGIDPEKMAKIEERSMGQPHFVFFPQDNKKGLRYCFDFEITHLKMFLSQKSPVLKSKQAKKIKFVVNSFCKT